MPIFISRRLERVRMKFIHLPIIENQLEACFTCKRRCRKQMSHFSYHPYISPISYMIYIFHINDQYSLDFLLCRTRSNKAKQMEPPTTEPTGNTVSSYRLVGHRCITTGTRATDGYNDWRMTIRSNIHSLNRLRSTKIPNISRRAIGRLFIATETQMTD